MTTTEDVTVEKRRVKHARITVTPDLQVRLVVPMRTRRVEIDAIIEGKSSWIQRQLDHFRGMKSRQVKLGRAEILLHGEVYRFRLRPELKGRTTVDESTRTVSSGRDLLADGALERWYREQARIFVTDRLAYYSSRHGFKHGKVSIRNQRTRWGSCSSRRNLSFNWRLVQLPPHIVDYVVVHELVHTKLLSHSKAFWAEVASICPDYRQAVAFLRNCPAGQQSPVLRKDECQQ